MMPAFSTMRITVRFGAGAVDNAAGNNERLAGVELNGFVFEVDEELAFDGEKEFVLVVVLVPVVFAFDDSDADDGVVDLAESLIEPLVVFRVGDVDVDDFERAVKDVEASLIGKGGGVGHVETPPGRITGAKRVCPSGTGCRGITPEADA
jgi:hypothetical protein